MMAGRLHAAADAADAADAGDDDDVDCSGNVKMAQVPSTKPSSRAQPHVTSATNMS
jgi:hypothetical protein